MANTLLSYAGWYVLPNLVSGWVQTALYTIFIRAGDPKPARGTPRFVRDRKRIQIAVIVAYLLYTIYEADYQLLRDGNFYSLLGVPHDASDKTIQSKFRRLTVQFHPDKATGPNKPAIEALYISLKDARDTLSDPIKRFAYDRFGPDIRSWHQSCSTLPDYIFMGLRTAGAYYFATVVGLILLSVLGYLKQGMFSRYLAIASLCTVELFTVTRPEFPVVLASIVNPALVATGLRAPYLPFEMIALLRKCTVTFFIALSQLSPLLQDPKQAEAGNGPGVSPQQLDRIEALTHATDQEITRLVSLELTPFSGNESSARELKAGLKEWLVSNTIRNDPEVKAAITSVLERRRLEGGTDARLAS